MSDAPAAVAFRNTKSFCNVNGYQMAYVEQKGKGTIEDTLLFLHGNPTSSYLWRNIMEPLQGDGRRLIAPDLIGMGDSDKLTDSSDAAYSFLNHADFVEAFIEDCVRVGPNDKIILVIHDWGSALGFDWAYHHPNQVKGIAYMEAIAQPLSYDHFDADTAGFFQAVRTPGVGEQMILENNVFVEAMLPGAILRNLTQDEMSVYLDPYTNPGEDRRPTLTWPREVPINGTPAVNVERVSEYSQWMGQNDIPKLLVVAKPGILVVDESLALVRTWKNQQEVTVDGIHFIQEDSPNQIAYAIEDWLANDAFLKSSASMEEGLSSDPDSMAPMNLGGGSQVWIFFIAVLLRKLF